MPSTPKNPSPPAPDHEVLIIGAGFGGIGAAIALRKAGIHNLLIVEKWHDVGGTWLANTYPGVAVDIPSVLYSYSFEQRGDWSRLFAPGAELLAYARDVVDKHGLGRKLRLSTTVTGATWDDRAHLWRVELNGTEEVTARFLINALGGLERPKLPDIDGIDDFDGKLLHTALWDHDYDLAGKRVAVIGTGASALQLIPELADQVEHLTVYQRTPIWVAPKPDLATNAITRRVLGAAPVRVPARLGANVAVNAVLGGALLFQEQAPFVIRGVEGLLKTWMRTQVPDAALRDKLTPRYAFGCKRPSLSNTYLRTFTRPHVDLVTEGIEHITPAGVVTHDGVERTVDALVCATGFQVMAKGALPPFPVTGRDGIDLGEFWDTNRFQAYQGVSVPGFPNSFLILGPYGYAPSSYFSLIESTAAHAARAIVETRRRGATSCEIRPEPNQRYFEHQLERSGKTPVLSDACAGSNSYYVNYHGDAAAFRSSLHAEMWWQNRHFPLDDYRYTAIKPATPRPSAPKRQPALASA